MNKCFFTGHLTRGPELKITPSGAKVCNFGLAVNERFNDRETGEQRETVCFVEIEAWNRQAELVFEFFKKGSAILVEGALKFDSWQADDGTTRNRLKVRLQRFEFMTQRTDSETGTAPEATTEQSDRSTSQPSDNSNQATGDEQPPF